jgi:protein tyrosine/serine phosphatase
MILHKIILIVNLSKNNKRNSNNNNNNFRPSHNIIWEIKYLHTTFKIRVFHHEFWINKNKKIIFLTLLQLIKII